MEERTAEQVRRVAIAFDLIARANTVTILSLGEMEAIVNRALTGEFDHAAQRIQAEGEKG